MTTELRASSNKLDRDLIVPGDEEGHCDRVQDYKASENALVARETGSCWEKEPCGRERGRFQKAG